MKEIEEIIDLGLSQTKPSKQNIQLIETLSGNLKIIRVKPKNLISGKKVLIAPGWAETTKTLEELGIKLGERGREAVLFDHPRKNGESKEGEEFLKARTLIKVILQECGGQKTDVIAHSEGAINTLIAASQYPELFDNIILVAPAGFNLFDNLNGIAVNFLKESANNIAGILKDKRTIKPLLRYVVENQKYILANIPKALREVNEICSSDIVDLLKQAIANGIKVSIIHGKGDKLFPIQSVSDKIKNSGADFYQVPGTHIRIFVYPQRIVSLINHILKVS